MRPPKESLLSFSVIAFGRFCYHPAKATAASVYFQPERCFRSEGWFHTLKQKIVLVWLSLLVLSISYHHCFEIRKVTSRFSNQHMLFRNRPGPPRQPELKVSQKLLLPLRLYKPPPTAAQLSWKREAHLCPVRSAYF